MNSWPSSNPSLTEGMENCKKYLGGRDGRVTHINLVHILKSTRLPRNNGLIIAYIQFYFLFYHISERQKLLKEAALQPQNMISLVCHIFEVTQRGGKNLGEGSTQKKLWTEEFPVKRCLQSLQRNLPQECGRLALDF